MKKTLSVLLALCLVLSVAACAFADAAAKDGGSKITFTTGGEAGTYFGFGGVLAQKVSEVTSTDVTAITSGGSQAMFFKVNTWGEETFLDKLRDVLDRFRTM